MKENQLTSLKKWLKVVTVAKWAANNGSTIKLFVRLEVGEGIEKVVTNFAEEVMSQVRA